MAVVFDRNSRVLRDGTLRSYIPLAVGLFSEEGNEIYII